MILHLRNILLAAVICPSLMAADQSLLPQRLSDQEAQQQTIRKRTADVADQISSIIDEYDRNGLSDGDDVHTLKAIRGVLSNLSAQQMQQVVALLQQARSSSIDLAHRDLTTAYAQQKGIIAQLRQLLVEYRKQQAVADLAARFQQLAQRQASNLKSTVQLAKAVASQSRDQWQSKPVDALDVQQQEQNALKSEIAQALGELQTMSQTASSDVAPRLRDALNKSKSTLTESASGAADDLAAANLFRAAANEKTARDQLRDLARAIAGPIDPQAEKKRAAAELADIAAQQEQIAAAANDPTKSADLEQKQADLVDQLEQATRDLADNSKTKTAQQQMQQVRAALARKDSAAASKAANDAANQLKDAQKQIANTAPANAPTTNVADASALKETREKIAELIKSQQETELNTSLAAAHGAPSSQSNPQSNVAEKTAQTTNSLPPQSKTIVQRPLVEAKSAMDCAASDLQKSDVPSAQRNQRSALTSLIQAKNALDQAIRDATGPSTSQDAQRLASIESSLDQMQQELHKPASDNESRSNQLAKLANQTASLAASDEGALSDPASRAMAEAQSALARAAVAASSANPAPDDHEPLEKLAQAKAAVALARAGLTSQEALRPAPPNANAQSPSRAQANSSANSSSAGGQLNSQPAGAQPPDVQGTSKFLALPQRDRDALLQSQRENWPPEYAPAIEQYLRNLAEQSSK